MIVKSLTLREVPPAPDMFLRPIAANYTPKDMVEFDNVTQGGVLIDKNTLAGVANSILKPAGDPTAITNIAQGWGASRFMFVMEIDIRRQTNSVSTEIISGYTNYMGVQPATGSIDPNMEFYVNNQVTVAQNVVHSSHGNTWIPMVTGNNQVFTPANVATTNTHSGYATGDMLSTQRPADLFTVPMVDSVAAAVMSDYGQIAPNTVPRHGGEAIKLSRRSNLSAGSYLSSTLESQRSARRTADYMGDRHMDLMNEAARNVSEHTISNNKVFLDLMRETRFLQSGMFTYSELIALDTTGTLDSRVNVFFTDNRNQSIQQYSYDRNNCDGWTGRDHATMIGLQISSQLPGILADCLVSDCTFSATNYTPNGQMVVAVETVNMLFPANSGIDSRIYYDKLVHMIQLMLATEATMLGGGTLDIKAVASTTNSIRMDISIDGEPPVPKFYPVFSDSSISTMLNNSMDKVKMLSDDILSLSESTDAKMMNNLGLGVGSTNQITNFTDNVTSVASQHAAASPAPSWGLNIPGTPAPAAVAPSWGFSTDPLPQ